MQKRALAHGALQQAASHFAGVNWNSSRIQRMAPLPHITHHWIYTPVPRGLPKHALHAMASALDEAREKERKKWADGITWRLTRFFFFVPIQDFHDCSVEWRSSQCQDTLLNRQSLLCSSCNFSWLEEVSHNPCGWPSHVQKLFTGRSKGQKFRKPGGNLPRKYLQCCIYIVACPVTCMKENAVGVVIEFNNCILQLSPCGLKKIVNRLLDLYWMFMFRSLNFNFQFF